MRCTAFSWWTQDLAIALWFKRARIPVSRNRRSMPHGPATFATACDVRFPAFHFDLERFDRLRVIDPAARTDPSPNRRHRSVDPFGARSYFQPGRHAYRLTIAAIILLSLPRFAIITQKFSRDGTCLALLVAVKDSFPHRPRRAFRIMHNTWTAYVTIGLY
jgi:hypothetical protein